LRNMTHIRYVPDAAQFAAALNAKAPLSMIPMRCDAQKQPPSVQPS
jgi:hypothetical protein